MPRGRMIDKRISESRRIADVSDKARVVYFMVLPHLDVNGAFRGEGGYIKWNTMRHLEYTYKDVDKALVELHNVGLVQLYEVKGDMYIKYDRFREFQTNQVSKEGATDIPLPDEVQTHSRPTPELVATQVKDKDKDKDKEQDKAVSVFWDYFLKKTKKNYTLTSDRKKIIQGALSRYKLEDLQQATVIMMKDTWVERRNFMDVKYAVGVIKGVDNVEKWLNFSNEEADPDANVP